MAIEGELSGTQGVTCSCGTKLPFEVLQSAAGFYLGYFCPNCGGPWSRESEYFPSQEIAEAFMKSLKDEDDTSKLRTTERIEESFTLYDLAEEKDFNAWVKIYLRRE